LLPKFEQHSQTCCPNHLCPRLKTYLPEVQNH
jgi:hypothetical protein